jgi:hypothetical protein
MGLLTAEVSGGNILGATTEQLPKSCAQLIAEAPKCPLRTANRNVKPQPGKTVRLFDARGLYLEI